MHGSHHVTDWRRYLLPDTSASTGRVFAWRERYLMDFVALLVAVCLRPASGWAQEREATSAVVNPALRSALRQTLSLDGEWEFAIDPSAAGEQQKWFRP